MRRKTKQQQEKRERALLPSNQQAFLWAVLPLGRQRPGRTKAAEGHQTLPLGSPDNLIYLQGATVNCTTPFQTRL